MITSLPFRFRPKISKALRPLNIRYKANNLKPKRKLGGFVSPPWAQFKKKKKNITVHIAHSHHLVLVVNSSVVPILVITPYRWGIERPGFTSVQISNQFTRELANSFLAWWILPSAFQLFSLILSSSHIHQWPLPKRCQSIWAWYLSHPLALIIDYGSKGERYRNMQGSGFFLPIRNLGSASNMYAGWVGIAALIIFSRGAIGGETILSGSWGGSG